jgi:hypothetical protein
VADKEMSSVLASLDLDSVRLGRAALKGVRLKDGRLTALTANRGARWCHAPGNGQ